MFKFIQHLDWRIIILGIISVFFLIWFIWLRHRSVEDIDISKLLNERRKKRHAFIYEELPETPRKNENAYISKSEEECRRAMESFYPGHLFKKQRPKWLVNPDTGHCLELDCYNEELEIAVEYNGIQHYEFPNYFMTRKEEFIAQLRRDQTKKEICEQHNVYLIIVPYTVKIDEIKDYLYFYLPETVSDRNRWK